MQQGEAFDGRDRRSRRNAAASHALRLRGCVVRPWGYRALMHVRRRAAAWIKDDPFGVEFADIELTPERLAAEGVAIGTTPGPYRLDYRVETSAGFVTSRLRVTSRGEGWRRTLDLRRSDAGAWSLAVDGDGDGHLPPGGGDPVSLADALDCDLGLSPVTNLMPILRHDLLSGGGPVELITAWVSVPDLSVRRDGQRYSYLRGSPDHHVVRYEATDGSFTADITVDREGIVVDYPGIARRLPQPPAVQD